MMFTFSKLHLFLMSWQTQRQLIIHVRVNLFLFVVSLSDNVTFKYCKVCWPVSGCVYVYLFHTHTLICKHDHDASRGTPFRVILIRLWFTVKSTLRKQIISVDFFQYGGKLNRLFRLIFIFSYLLRKVTVL